MEQYRSAVKENNQNGMYQEEFSEQRQKPTDKRNQDATEREERATAVSADQKKLSILVYITWIGFIIAMVKGDTADPYFNFHLNQALLINLMAVASFMIPLVGIPITVFGIVCWVIALSGALKGERREAPLIGGIQLIR